MGISATSAARVLEKRSEYEAIQALEDLTGDMVKTLQALADQGQVMADGGRSMYAFFLPTICSCAMDDYIAIASVMSNWPNVLRVISLFGMSTTLLGVVLRLIQ